PNSVAALRWQLGTHSRQYRRVRSLSRIDPQAVALRFWVTGALAGSRGIWVSRSGMVGLHIEHQHAIVAGGHLEDMEAVNTEDLISPSTPGGAGRTRRVRLLPADTPQTAKPSSTLIWEVPVKDTKTEVGCCPLVRTRPNINLSR